MIKHYAAVLGLLISSSASLAVEEYNVDLALATQQQGEFTFDGINYHSLRYTQQGQDKVWGGDILLHPSQELSPSVQKNQAFGLGLIQDGVGVKSLLYRWPNGTIPYQFVEDRADYPGLHAEFLAYTTAELATLRTVMADVTADYATNSSVRIMERTAANASQYPNYVVIGNANGCFSNLGNVTGSSTPYQTMGLDVGDHLGTCIHKGVIVHEFGHAFGLYHEQSRSDRDSYVTINTSNIIAGKEFNFDKVGASGSDIGPYNYSSIMHYGKTAFSKNNLDTISPLGGQSIGQRNGLDAGDSAALNTLYASDLSITSQISPNLQANTNFDWLIGLEHKASILSSRSASEIKVVAQLPSTGYQLINQTSGWSCTLAGDTTTCTRADNLASTASTQLSITLKANSTAASNQTFTATVSSLSHDPVTTNNSNTSTSNILTDVAAPYIDSASFGASPTAGKLSVTLGWPAIASALEYDIERSQTAGSGYSTLQTGITALQYKDNSALPEQTYYYRLKAKNSFSEKTSSDKAVTTPKAVTAPSSVTIAIQGLGIVLNWSAASNADSYTVSRSKNGGSYQTIRVLSNTELSYIDNAVQSNTSYKYKVTANNNSSTADTESTDIKTPPAVSTPTSSPAANPSSTTPSSSEGGSGATGSGLLLLLGMLHIYRRKQI